MYSELVNRFIVRLVKVNDVIRKFEVFFFKEGVLYNVSSVIELLVIDKILEMVFIVIKILVKVVVRV